jgi:hypothetical protein
MAIYRNAADLAAPGLGRNGQYRPRAEVGQSLNAIKWWELDARSVDGEPRQP